MLYRTTKPLSHTAGSVNKYTVCRNQKIPTKKIDVLGFHLRRPREMVGLGTRVTAKETEKADQILLAVSCALRMMGNSKDDQRYWVDLFKARHRGLQILVSTSCFKKTDTIQLICCCCLYR